MIQLVTGGSGSGKSAYAEHCILESGIAVRYYVATMKPFGEEGWRRIQKHRRMRSGKGFVTIERTAGLAQLRLGLWPGGRDLLPGGDAAALLECVPNLVANEQFDVGGSDEQIVARIGQGIRNLYDQVKVLVVVTQDAASDGCQYDADTMRYLRLLQTVNRRLAGMADRVTEVVYGIPVPVKERGQ